LPDEDDPPDLDVHRFAGCRARPERVQQERRFQLDHAAARRRYHPGTGTGSHPGTGFHRSGRRQLRHVASGQRFGHGADEQRQRHGAGQWFDRGTLIEPEAISRLAALNGSG
jgi:hypothetical protein